MSMSCALRAPEYPRMPSSFARARSSATVQSSYEPDSPPRRPTAFRPSRAAALEMRAAFCFDAPSLRSSS
jgi:hypothetical protein